MVSQFGHDLGQSFFGEAIEEEVSHEQIVAFALQPCLAEIGANELNPAGLDSRARDLDHARARLDTINFRAGVRPDELGEKAAVPLTCHQHPPRRGDLPNERGSRLLEFAPEDERLEPAIMRRDPIEVHRREKSRTASGVSRTRSASAVRLSRARSSERFSLTSSSALTPMQIQSGQAKCQKIPNPIAPRASA